MALQTRDKNNIERAQHRIADATDLMTHAAPEQAIDKLTDALDLLRKVEEGGDEWRRRAETLLEAARTNQSRMEQAAAYASDSVKAIDPYQSWMLLQRAKDTYPEYPQIAERIQQIERQLVDRVLVEMHSDRMAIEALLNNRNFEDARSIAGQMMQRGRNLDFIFDHEEYQKQVQATENLLRDINSTHNAWRRLQDRLKNAHRALDNQELSVARILFDALAKDYSNDEIEIVRLRIRLAKFGDESERWREAQKLFDQAQDFDQIIGLCEALSTSSEFGQQANDLQPRAEGRLWTEQAESYTQRGRWQEAQALYRRIVDLRQSLPSADRYLIDQAEAALKGLQGRAEQAKSYEDEMRKIEQARAESKWSEWYNRLTALKSKAGDLLQHNIENERVTGIPEWRDDALTEAERILVIQGDDRWRGAFERLKPLFTIGAIGKDNPRFCYIAYHYHTYEADLRANSKAPGEQDRAVEYRRQALAFAAPQDQQNAQTALQQTIRNRALTLARHAATDSGPRHALDILKEQLEKYQRELQEDGEVWGRFIQYALQSEDFETAHTTAQSLQFVDSMKPQARTWQQMVDAIKGFQGRDSLPAWEQRTKAILDVSAMAGEEAVLLNEVLDEFRNRLADRLRAYLFANRLAGFAGDTLQRARIYSLMLQLQPTDQRMRSEMEKVYQQILTLARNLIERTKLLLGGTQSNLDGELTQLTSIDVRIEELLQTFRYLNVQADEPVQVLIQNQRNIQQRIELLRKHQDQAAELERLFQRVLTEDWAIEELENTLSATLATARTLGVDNRTNGWEDRFHKIKTELAELKRLFIAIQENWDTEDFDKVQASCDALDSQLLQSRIRLSEPSLSFPDGYIEVYDTYSQRSLNTVEVIRNAATEKKQMLSLWRDWVQRFETLQEQSRISYSQVTKQIQATPPCLSKARDPLINNLGHMQSLNHHLEAKSLPPTPLSSEANRYKRMIEETNLRGQIEIQLTERQHELNLIDRRIKDLDRSLDQLRDFMRGVKNMGLIANQETFRGLAEPIRQADACHPELLNLIERFERLAGVKY